METAGKFEEKDGKAAGNIELISMDMSPAFIAAAKTY
jgi:hypothetical protein